MRFRFHRLAAVALAAALAGTTAACGGSDSPTPNSGSAEDFGPYSTQRPDSSYDSGTNQARGRLVESLRLGEHVVFGSEIAPEVAVQRYAQVPIGERGTWSGVQVHQMQAALPFNPYGGFVSEMADTPYLANHLASPMVKVVLIAFPDDSSAAAAATAMAASDFALNNANTPVSVPDQPAALSHWVPTYADIGSWMAYRSVVIHVIAQAEENNLDQLTGLLSKTYQAQTRKLANYLPVALDEVETLSLDRDKLLTRLVNTADTIPDARTFAVHGPNTFATITSTDPAELAREYESRGVTAVAVSDNKYLYKLRDAETTKSFTNHLADAPTVSKYTRMGGISGVEDIACFQATDPHPTEMQARRYRCLIPHENVLAEVFSDQETDVRQLAAAQYALLTDGE
ncbi:hypothetical protein HLB23_18910 [Nocardia uniformis]|uniref:Fe/B12 periplasmic-binding domain-containing protein n=1 Tax=Nocardia uniformis TaxID=53432 RepID=A0A849BZC5_9NOCA|nr:hypothetical protein [Nocardia uniformis]NNH71903.1 hypothetical protein [Nocardia uniformis]